jgi:hypothetical protein
VEESAPSETNEETSKTQLLEKNKDDGGTIGPAGTLSGNRPGEAELRKEQREQLENNYREKQVRGEEFETDHRSHKHIPGKKEMAVRL